MINQKFQLAPVSNIFEEGEGYGRINQLKKSHIKVFILFRVSLFTSASKAPISSPSRTENIAYPDADSKSTLKLVVDIYLLLDIIQMPMLIQRIIFNWLNKLNSLEI